MKLKQITILIALLIVFVSCSPQDNKGNIMSVNETNKVSISQIWDGYEELQGKKYGDIFTLPAKISPEALDELYTFEIRNPEVTDSTEEKGRESFRKFFGDKFDESRCVYDPENEIMNYTSGDDGNSGQCIRGGISLNKNFEILSEIKDQVVAVLDPIKDSDKAVELGSDTIKVSEICQSVTAFLNDLCSDYTSVTDGFELRPYKIYYYTSDTGKEYVQINVGYKFKGIFLQNWFSSLSDIQRTAEGSDETFYMPAHIRIVMDSKDNIVSSIPSSRAILPTDIQKCEAIISLKEAVRILERELAENSKYSFEEIRLIYCAKCTNHITGNNGAQEPTLTRYEPTWSFDFETKYGDYGRKSIKVNAVTGEITVEVK